MSMNNDNFLVLLEFLEKFDFFIAEYLEKCGNKGSGSISYLTKIINVKFIEIIAD